MSPRIAWILIATLALPLGGDASRIIFVKDTGGRVTHYIYGELGGTDRIVKIECQY